MMRISCPVLFPPVHLRWQMNFGLLPIRSQLVRSILCGRQLCLPGKVLVNIIALVVAHHVTCMNPIMSAEVVRMRAELVHWHPQSVIVHVNRGERNQSQDLFIFLPQRFDLKSTEAGKRIAKSLDHKREFIDRNPLINHIDIYISNVY